jgi:hypothetical protein
MREEKTPEKSEWKNNEFTTPNKNGGRELTQPHTSRSGIRRPNRCHTVSCLSLIPKSRPPTWAILIVVAQSPPIHGAGRFPTCGPAAEPQPQAHGRAEWCHQIEGHRRGVGARTGREARVPGCKRALGGATMQASRVQARVQTHPRGAAMPVAGVQARVQMHPRGATMPASRVQVRVQMHPRGARIRVLRVQVRVQMHPRGATIPASRVQARVQTHPRGAAMPVARVQVRVQTHPRGARIQCPGCNRTFGVHEFGVLGASHPHGRH